MNRSGVFSQENLRLLMIILAAIVFGGMVEGFVSPVIRENFEDEEDDEELLARANAEINGMDDGNDKTALEGKKDDFVNAEAANLDSAREELRGVLSALEAAAPAAALSAAETEEVVAPESDDDDKIARRKAMNAMKDMTPDEKEEYLRKLVKESETVGVVEEVEEVGGAGDEPFANYSPYNYGYQHGYY